MNQEFTCLLQFQSLQNMHSLCLKSLEGVELCIQGLVYLKLPLLFDHVLYSDNALKHKFQVVKECKVFFLL